MKKSFSVLLALVLVFLFLFTGCGETDTVGYLAKLAKKDYSEIALTETVTVGGDTLTSTVTVKNEKKVSYIAYAVETLNEIGFLEAPTTDRTVKTGSVTEKKGKIIEQNGVEIEKIDFPALSGVGMKFSDAFFADMVWQEGKFEAKVTDPAGFFGKTDFSADNMRVTVLYGESLDRITVTYKTSDGASVTADYTFTA
ncbi:MAG: hypothetical protein ACI3XE_03160 [Eubacteriales bacterium]